MTVLTRNEQILTAARTLFLRLGYDGATTDELAETAGVSKETLYRYYPTKEDLLTAVVRQMAEDRRSALGEIQLPARASRSALAAALRRLLEDARLDTTRPEFIKLLRLVIGESARRPHLAKLVRGAVGGGGTLRRLLDAAKEQGLIRRDVQTDVAAQMLGGTLLAWVVTNGLLGGTRGEPSTTLDLDEVVRLFVRAISP